MSRILSLCTGYAGLDLAVEAVTGARTVAVSDLDKGANKILAHRFPTIPNLGDLKAIDWAAWAGVEVMTAGYPCQPFSHAGKREGTDDPRHIFPFIADGIRIVGPRLVVLENVRGHLALGFDTVLGTLADIGYDARWVCVRASDVGAPHRRERLFIVATPNTDRSGLQEHGHQGAVRPERSGAGTATDGGGGTPASLGHDGPTCGPATRAEVFAGIWCACERSAAANAGRGQLAGSAVEVDGLRLASERGRVTAPDASGERHGRWEDGRGLGRLDGPDEGGSRERERSREVAGDRGAEAAADTASAGLNGSARPNRQQDGRSERPSGSDADGRVRPLDWGQYAPAINRWSAVLGRPAPAPTEPGAKGQPRLSPRFVEHMMGLPAGWVTDVPDLTRNEQLKALGNGVVPQQAMAALTFLLNAQEKAA